MEKTFEGMTKTELINYLHDNTTLQFGEYSDMECSLVNDNEIAVWNIYDHNDVSCHYIDEFFDIFS